MNVEYDPMTGQFTRGGMPTGRVTHLGYLKVYHEGRRVFAHRLAWFLTYGEWPVDEIDHINRNRLDNRITNLRVVTRSVQVQNKIYPNTTGWRGVKFHIRSGRWNARITKGGVTRSLGLFDTPREAHIAYALEALEIYGPEAKLA